MVRCARSALTRSTMRLSVLLVEVRTNLRAEQRLRRLPRRLHVDGRSHPRPPRAWQKHQRDQERRTGEASADEERLMEDRRAACATSSGTSWAHASSWGMLPKAMVAATAETERTTDLLPGVDQSSGQAGIPLPCPREGRIIQDLLHEQAGEEEQRRSSCRRTNSASGRLRVLAGAALHEAPPEREFAAGRGTPLADALRSGPVASRLRGISARRRAHPSFQGGGR